MEGRNDSHVPLESSSKQPPSSPTSIMSTHAPFQNLDDPSVLQHSLHLSSQPSTQNFILEFGDSHAHIAFDVSASLLENLLSSERPDAMCTRWINLWSPFPQREILEGLARGYDFSPRLLALMGSDPRRVESERGVSAYARAAGHERSFALSDLESRGGSSSGSGNGSAASSLQSRLESLEQTEFGMGRGNAARTGNLYDIVDEVWHYSSLDQGRSYLCLGYNSLYPIGNISPSTSPSRSSRSRSRSRLGSEEDRVEREKRTERGKREERATTGLPNVKRIWTWLLLLSDRTVVTITEDPYPNLPPSALSPAQRQITNLIRRNTTNILRSLSTLPDTPDRSLTPYHPTSQSPLHLLPLRNRLGRTAPESAHRTTDAPGLLFYYIFEDWENSYALVTRRESYYSSQLLALRTRMFEKPELAHVRDLERIGKELGVLKRWFEAYLRLVDGVVEPMAVSAASLAGSFVEKEGAVGGDRRGGRGRGTSGGSGGSGRSGGFAVSTTRTTQVVNTDLARDISSPVENSVATVLQAPQGVLLNTESLLGVSISSAARVRFERLKDMITLYALSECEDCLRQKEELVQMNFQLIAIKESIDVERLTRAAFLISKATVLFLPVSFMTSYFSADFGFSYTLKTYWITFAIVLAASWLVLVAFGVLSGTMDSWRVFSGVKWAVGCIGRMRGRGTKELGVGGSGDGSLDVGLRQAGYGIEGV